MKILAIETSADETAVALLETIDTGYSILGEGLFSQASLHSEYGGIYPNLAKREHQKNLVPLTIKVLAHAELLVEKKRTIENSITQTVRDEDFRTAVQKFLETHDTPPLDLIAVTCAPGLEIALWNGITFAESLGKAWNVPVVGVNHLEGHIVSALFQRHGTMLTQQDIRFPMLALLISGGHTELIAMKDWFQYELVGRTRDDAVGEAFDKVARLLNLPYPGGPHIAAYAEKARTRTVRNALDLPRPMINEQSCDFSFSGLKTAVMYLIKELGELSEEMRENIAMEFEDAARDVLVSKTKRAIERVAPSILVVGGGVSANIHIKKGLKELLEKYPDTTLHYPAEGLTGDNAIMIGIAAGLRARAGKINDQPLPISVKGSQSLSEI